MELVVQKMRQITLISGVLLMVVCFQTKAYGYSAVNNVFNHETNVASQDTVRGKITDQTTGEALPGANVFIKGTQIGTATNARGRYQLAVSSLSDTLEVSYIGYVQKEVAINGRRTINVKLISQTVKGEQLVVVGYGTQKQQDVTGSVGTVQMQAVNSQPITGANEALAGQIAGVQVNTTNGIPGGGPEIHIRGVGAIGAGTSPLYVVDGFPLPANSSQISNPLNNIAPTDIQSINVLKGPSATAIYGSRASNGVVIITTKQGKEGKVKFHVDAYNGWQSIPHQEVTPMMNAEQFATFQKQWIEDQNRAEGTNTPIPQAYQNPSQYAGKGTDWFAAMTRLAPQQNLNFSASGGNKHITAYLSGGVFRQKGVVIGSDYNRVSFRANINAHVSSKFELGLNFAPTYSFGKNAVTGSEGRGGYFGSWEYANPIPPVYNSDGTYNPMIGTTNTWNVPNPVMALNEITRKKNTADILGNIFATYNILSDLTWESTFNMEWNNVNQNQFTPSTIGGIFNPPPTIPSGYYSQDKFLNWANENRLTYDHTFAGGNHVTLMADFSEQQQLNNSSGFNGTQFADNSIKTLNGAAQITGGTYADSWTLASYLARLNYSYKERYLITATIRRDGSSRFGPNKRWGTFPSIGVGWRITSEPWMEKYSSWLSNLKLRGSYGLSGNNQIGNFTYESQLNTSNYVLGGSLAGGKVISSMSNPNLAWEKTAEINLGLNAGFLNNRITVTTDVYRSRTKNLLLDLNVPESSGFETTKQNIGEVQNEGFEFQVESQNVVKQNFTWSTNFNFSTNRNKTLSLGPDGAPIFAGRSGENHPTNITEIGKPVGMLYGYKFLGLYSQSQINDPNVAKFPNAIPGNMWVQDVNGDGKITPVTDFTIIGNPYPKFTYGITNTLRYKDLSLNVIFTGSYGAQRMQMATETLHNIDGIFNVPVDIANRYRSPQNPGNGKIPTTAGPSLGRVMYRDVSSLDVFNASYLWCKNIMLGYSLPRSLTKGYFSNVEVYTSIENAFIITPYPHGNPATTSYVVGANGGGTLPGYGGPLSPGIDFNPYPTPRVITVGIKINY